MAKAYRQSSKQESHLRLKSLLDIDSMHSAEIWVMKDETSTAPEKVCGK
jgi:hypothetical protein